MLFKKNIMALMVLVFGVTAAAQEINLTSIMGARNAAMGDANISEPNDISSMYLNPASLHFLKEKSILINHGVLRDNLGMTDNFAIPVFQLSQLTLSLGLESYHLGYIGEEHPSFSGQHIFEYGYSLSISTNVLAQTLSVGATAGFRHGKTDLTNTWAASYSVGVNYSPSADINYGLVLSGLGDEIRYLPEESVLKAKKESAFKRLVVGASMKYPSSSSLRRTVFVLALANEKIFGKSGSLYKAGMEFRPWNFLDFRFGYVFGPDVSEPRVGAGINFSVFIVEYVFYAGPSPIMSQQFSLSIKM